MPAVSRAAEVFALDASAMIQVNGYPRDPSFRLVNSVRQTAPATTKTDIVNYYNWIHTQWAQSPVDRLFSQTVGGKIVTLGRIWEPDMAKSRPVQKVCQRGNRYCTVSILLEGKARPRYVLFIGYEAGLIFNV